MSVTLRRTGFYPFYSMSPFPISIYKQGSQRVSRREKIGLFARQAWFKEIGAKGKGSNGLPSGRKVGLLAEQARLEKLCILHKVGLLAGQPRNLYIFAQQRRRVVKYRPGRMVGKGASRETLSYWQTQWQGLTSRGGHGGDLRQVHRPCPSSSRQTIKGGRL